MAQIINNGKKILAERKSKQLKGKVKSVLSKVFGKLLVGTSVGVFLVAGFFSANVLLTIH